jgi:hypothetical protein
MHNGARWKGGARSEKAACTRISMGAKRTLFWNIVEHTLQERFERAQIERVWKFCAHAQNVRESDVRAQMLKGVAESPCTAAIGSFS